MIITLERTRIIVTEYTEVEKRRLERMVSTQDKIFICIDEDFNKIFIAPGLIDEVRERFPKATFIDKSKEYWKYASISPVEHSAEPRNRLQKDFIEYVLKGAKHGKKIAGVLSPGQGKGVPIQSKIPTANGYTRMMDLMVGDIIFGSNGDTVKVTGIYDQGIEDVYKITFNDGRFALCDENHLWPTFKWDLSIKVVSTKDMLKDFKVYSAAMEAQALKEGVNREPYDYKYKIPLLTGPVQYNYQDLPIDPYVLGAFIGNGVCGESALTISSGNEFVPQKIADTCGFTLMYPKFSYTYHFKDKNGYVKTRDFFKDIPEMINCYSRDKFIPEIYKYNSLSNRMKLLQGLMDTDGTIGEAIRYNISYSSCSKKLLEDIQEMIYGLGFYGNISQDKREEKYVNGYHGILSIRVPNKFKPNLFTLPDKLHRAAQASQYPGKKSYRFLTVKDIRKIGKEHCKCISVDSEDKLYLANDFIVTHNTFVSCYAATKLNDRFIVVTHSEGIKNQWIKTLREMFDYSSDDLINISGSNVMEAIMNDEVKLGDVFFANHATLRNYLSLHNGYMLHQFFKKLKVGVKIYDESHLEFANILLMDFFSNTKRNWYLTATFDRSDREESKCFKRAFSSVLQFGEYESKEVTEKHVVYHVVNINSKASPRDKSKICGFRGMTGASYGRYAFQYDEKETIFKAITIILDKIKDLEGKIIVYTPLIESCDKVAAKLEELYPDKSVAAYHSHISASEKDDALKKDIIVSTIKSMGVGRDLKGLRSIICAEPIASKVVATQLIGRLRPYAKDTETFFFDIVDISIPPINWWFRSRMKAIDQLAKRIVYLDITG